MSPLERSEKFQFRLTPEERTMLDALADSEGLSPSDMLRQLVRRAFVEMKESGFPRIHGPVRSPPTAVRRPKPKPKK